MTRKHFAAIADAIRTEVDAAQDANDAAAMAALLRVARLQATVFANTNPRFDRARFMTACGFGA